MAALLADFPAFDEELLKAMVEDQGGDFLEVRAVLRVSVTLYLIVLFYGNLLSQSQFARGTYKVLL